MKEITVDAMIENMNTVTAFVDDFLDQIACPMKSRIQINIVSSLSDIYRQWHPL